MMNTDRDNINRIEVAKFDSQGDMWWEPEGDFKVLHKINPLRMEYMTRRVSLKGRAVADIGCGGGILTEAMAADGASVVGIDVSPPALEAARRRHSMSRLDIDYLALTAEQLAGRRPQAFDVVTCMELLEHVPDPDSVVRACAMLAKPGGDLFFGTINRTWMAFVLVILVAEYVLKIVKKRTHTYRGFIKPRELAVMGQRCGLELRDISGFTYLPMAGKAVLWPITAMNFLMHFHKPAHGRTG